MDKKYNIKTITSFVIDYNTFDQMVNDNVPAFKNNHYECVCDNEWNNDSNYSTTISESDLTKSYYQNNLQKLDSIDGKTLYINWQTILLYLASKNIIPFGEYSIEVSW